MQSNFAQMRGLQHVPLEVCTLYDALRKIYTPAKAMPNRETGARAGLGDKFGLVGQLGFILQI